MQPSAFAVNVALRLDRFSALDEAYRDYKGFCMQAMKPFLLVLCGLLSPYTAHAESQNQIPSCYVANKMAIPIPVPEKEVVILIHESMALDDALKSKLFSVTESLIKPGVQFSILQFSAQTQGRYLTQKAGGVIEQSPNDSVRRSISVRKLKNFDNCLASQESYGRRLAVDAEKAILNQNPGKAGLSEIISSATEASRILGKTSGTPNKILLIVSDMLENSATAKFRDANCMLKINPSSEIIKISTQKLLGDFGGASVYVLGAGKLGGACKSTLTGTRGVLQSFWHYPLNTKPSSPQALQVLESFWQSYFQKSNAKLVEFGKPMLLNPIQ